MSPYLLFWDVAQEIVEEHGHDARPLCIAPRESRPELGRIRMDTLVGMAFSMIVAIAIVFATAATLHASHIFDIASAAQAAEALRPIAGRFASLMCALGIIGSGLLAVPVLAGSAPYAVTEMVGGTG